MSNSSSSKDIKEDKEYIREDGLALDLAPEPQTRARLWESVGLSRQVVTPIDVNSAPHAKHAARRTKLA
jgi:hypothetical protein